MGTVYEGGKMMLELGTAVAVLKDIHKVSVAAKEIYTVVKEIKSNMPPFFDKIKVTETTEKVNIYESVSPKGEYHPTEYQIETAKSKYGIEDLSKESICSWEQLEEMNGDDFETKVLEQSSDKIKNCPISDGHWEGERGDSKWVPDSDYVPQKKNPEGKTWGEILKEFGIDGIDFKDGEPDFSEISKGDVEIEGFSKDRDDNFDKADQELAKKRGCTPEEVAKWRKEHGYTWHECRDMKTMQKVPSIIHSNITHRGGVSEAKKGE